MAKTGMQEDMSNVLGDLLHLEGLVESMLSRSVDALKSRDAALAHAVMDSDDQIDDMAQAIEEQAVRIMARRQPVASDLRRLIAVIHNTVDLERIADLAVNIAEEVPWLTSQPLLKPLIDIPRMTEIAQKMLSDGLNALRDDDVALAREVCLRDQEIDGLFMQVFRELISFMAESPQTINRAVRLLMIAHALERVGDHATNIAEMVFYQKTGERLTLRQIMAERGVKVL